MNIKVKDQIVMHSIDIIELEWNGIEYTGEIECSDENGMTIRVWDKAGEELELFEDQKEEIISTFLDD